MREVEREVEREKCELRALLRVFPRFDLLSRVKGFSFFFCARTGNAAREGAFLALGVEEG